MATKKKLLEAAAGAAGGAGGLNVEQVFSTYLYEGLGTPQIISNGVALSTNGPSTGTSTYFDGTSDSLTRSSALTGSSNGTQVTISVWVYINSADWANYIDIFDCGGNAGRLGVREGQLYIYFVNTTASDYSLTSTNLAPFAYNGWQHILISFDVSDTSKRHLYINDAVPSYVTWGTYQNQTANLTSYPWAVGSQDNGTSNNLQGNIAHFFFDNSYLDLSVTSNRRNFIDANGGSTSPSTISALNPLIYLPMTDGYTIGANEGTGGDFTSNGSPTIVNVGTEHDANLETEGGLVWVKARNNTNGAGHHLFDTERGALNKLGTNSTAAASNLANTLTSFNASGFSIGSDDYINGDGSASPYSSTYASWTFRKAPKFFDVVTYTGNQTVRTISHNLGSVPGCIIIKNLDQSDANATWQVYHRSLSSNASKFLRLNATDANFSVSSWMNDTAPTSTEFTLGTGLGMNWSGQRFVAYLFAHNDGDGDFGPTGDQDIIKCGSYTGNGSTTGPVIDLGFEPQWLLIKNASLSGSNWFLMDNMRGLVNGSTAATTDGEDPTLFPNLSNAEVSSGFNSVSISATGFSLNTTSTQVNGSGNTMIYIAIRRGPMAVPTDATEVFAVDLMDNSPTAPPALYTGFPVDMSFYRDVSTSANTNLSSRLTGAKILSTNTTDAETTNTLSKFDFMDGWFNYSGAIANHYGWMWKRAPSFFDVVAYTGDGTSNRNVSHNLGVAPEMIWVKARNAVKNWMVFLNDSGDYLRLNLTDALASTGSIPTWTDSSFSLAGGTSMNGSGTTYIAYLFASLDGVSKVGSYTGNGSTQTINCGFSSGARFVLIKRTDSTGDWYVWDTERGIVAANDPHLSLNTTAAEVTTDDSIDPVSSGFAVNQVSATNINVSSASYIYYAVS